MADMGRTISVDLQLWRRRHVLDMFSVCVREESRPFGDVVDLDGGSGLGTQAGG
jgi:hypothetical protein